jgi:hypothetical protein
MRVKWGQISTCYMRSLFSSYANCYVECRDLTPYETSYKKDKGVQIWNREIIAEKYFGVKRQGT